MHVETTGLQPSRLLRKVSHSESITRDVQSCCGDRELKPVSHYGFVFLVTLLHCYSDICAVKSQLDTRDRKAALFFTMSDTWAHVCFAP